MYRIRRFGVMKTATVVALMYVVIIAIFVVPFGIFALLFNGGSSSWAGMGAGFLVVGLLAALFYGAFGWVLTAIACALYNLVAGWVGGIEVQVEPVAPPPPVPVWGPTAATPTTPAPPAPPPYAG